jgi:RNA polymerase sigma factor (sigma-70 family)
MSPVNLRRYRAERLLRREFDALEGTVLTRVRARLRAAGVRLDAADLEACYAQAWHGLYMQVLEGAQIASPAAWLLTVTFRRAIDEHRERCRVAHPGPHEEPLDARDERCAAANAPPADRDLASELDDRRSLRHAFEAISARLSAREREAAVLCYLHGLSRAEAAQRMGISEARMRKLMDGRGRDRPGVAPKVAKLLDTVRRGEWCEEQGSLMRALAYGVLDPEGERYRLARLHRAECSACRAYVVSLRGLAAAMPPLPALAHAIIGSGSAAGGAAHGIRTLGAGGAHGAPGAALSPGASAASASAAAGAGGGWAIATGPLGAKLAAACVLALGVGAGCIAIGRGPEESFSARRHIPHARSRGRSARSARPAYLQGAPALAPARDSAPAASASAAQVHSTAANHEFGLEQPAAADGAAAATTATSTAATSTPQRHSEHGRRTSPGSASVNSSAAAASVRSSVGAPASVASSSAPGSSAEREFSPG